ncbi:hypothetical protein V6Z90_003430 [Aspergillus fumigatus]
MVPRLTFSVGDVLCLSVLILFSPPALILFISTSSQSGLGNSSHSLSAFQYGQCRDQRFCGPGPTLMPSKYCYTSPMSFHILFVSGVAYECQTDCRRRLDVQLLYVDLDADFYNAQSPYLDTLGPGVCFRLLSPSTPSSNSIG